MEWLLSSLGLHMHYRTLSGLKQQKSYHAALEAKSLRPRCQQGRASWRLQGPVGILSPWAYGQSTPVSVLLAPVCVCVHARACV